MDVSGNGPRLAASAVAPLVKRLFRQDEPGVGLTDRPVRIGALVYLTRLAANPLMCALHRTGHGYLPRGREALYEAALRIVCF